MVLTTPISSTSAISNHPGMGANLYPGGTAFRVWAKFATQVYVVGDFNNWSETANPLADEGNGYWSVDVSGAKEGDRYRYSIHSPFLAKPHYRTDPYAKRVENDIGNGYITSSEFDWGTNQFNMPAWNDLVIYELHVGSFCELHTDAIIKKVDYLQELGINAIELLPIWGFSGNTSLGYNPALPFAIESSYGKNSDLKNFVKAVHAKGIAVLLDVVYNHWGPQDLDVALWQIDGWSQDGSGGIYFYKDWRRHTDFGDRPDFGRPEVRQYIRDNVQMWLDEYQGEHPLLAGRQFVRKWNHQIKVNRPTMNTDKQERIEACIQELASLLYEETDQSQLTDLEGIEKTVRRQILERVSPEIAIFLSKKRQAQQ